MNANVTASIRFRGDVPALGFLTAGSGQGPRRLAVRLGALLRFAPIGMAQMRPAPVDRDLEGDRLLASALFQSLIKP